MAEIESLPKAPDIVLGVIDIQGRIVPAINLRRRFGLPEREIALSDRLIIARTSKRSLALLVDAVLGVFELPPAETVAAAAILPDLEYVEGVAKLSDGLVFIHNLETLLSLEEAGALDAALTETPNGR